MAATIHGEVSTLRAVSGCLAPGAAVSGELSGLPDVAGSLSPPGSLRGSLGEPVPVSGALAGEQEISGTLTITGGGYAPEYDGAYTVTPLAYDPVVLPTAGRRLARDVTVREVPYYETSNIYDGETVYIASEV